MTTQNAVVRIGTLTGRAIGTLVLALTSLSWFVFVFDQTPMGLTVALILTFLSLLVLGIAALINRLKS